MKMLNRIRRPHYKGCHQKVQQKKSMKRRMMATTTRRMTLRWGSDCQVLAVNYGCSCTMTMQVGYNFEFSFNAIVAHRIITEHKICVFCLANLKCYFLEFGDMELFARESLVESTAIKLLLLVVVTCWSSGFMTDYYGSVTSKRLIKIGSHVINFLRIHKWN